MTKEVKGTNNNKKDLHTQEPVLLGIIGHPISHSLSPFMYNSLFKKLNLNYVFKAFDVPESKLKLVIESMRILGFKGISVTHPHKVVVMDYLDDISEEAMKIGAVNTIVNRNGKLIGFNTDGDGYIKSLQQETNIQLQDANIFLLGAGGAGNAIGYKLSQKKINKIVIADKSQGKAEELAKKLTPYVKTEIFNMNYMKPLKNLKINLFINTTPIGMYPNINEKPFPITMLDKSIIVSDVIYNPIETLLVKEARNRGMIVHQGSGMLVYQGIVAFRIWTGKEVPGLATRELIDNFKHQA